MWRLILVFTLMGLGVMAKDISKIDALIEKCLPEVTALRHAIHAEPELAYTEFKTAEKIIAILEKLPGITLRKGVAGTGIVAVLGADKPGPCCALRADMDALPIQEETGVAYASKIPGKAHSCGHDGHVACLAGAAIALSQMADQLKGPVKFIFQPAEEGGAGARAMVEEGVLKNPDVKAIFALHGFPYLPVGTIATRSGASMASTDALDIVIKGVGTHAASPHSGVDPIVAASHVITALQGVVSRHTSPVESVVVTIGSIHGGTARNIIPDQVTLSGTIRTLSDSARSKTAAAVRRVVEQTAAAHGAEAEVKIKAGYPVMYNDAKAIELVEKTAFKIMKEELVHTNIPPSLGGEDFAFYAQQVPGGYWRLGVAKEGQPVVPLHSPRYNFADEALPTGIRLHVSVALAFADSDLAK